MTTDLQPSAVRYIKLGPGGAWFRRCIDEGLVELGHTAVPHEVAITGDRAAIEEVYLAQGRSPGKAKDLAREVVDFYILGEDALWITIGEGRLWWAFAGEEVIPAAGAPQEGRGARFRRVLGAWCSTDLLGAPLALEGLSTRLTKVGAYRQTLCRVEAEEYLVRRINGHEAPLVRRAAAARAEMAACASALIEQLTWRDFEVFADLIFAGSGWRRAGGLGGADQADTDLVLEQAATGERAFVQIKSRATQAVLDDYLERFQARSGFDRLFFLCHSPSGALDARGDARVALWQGPTLAEQALRAGLFDWLVEKAR